MHPAGIKYGLANNMLQLQGSSVLLSDQLLEHMSNSARQQLHGKRIDASDLLEDVINRGLGKIKLVETNPSRGEYRSFYIKVEMVLFETMFPYAERAGIGYRTGRTFYFTRAFASELIARKKVLRRAGEVYGYQKVLFLACYDAVVARCRRVIPEDSRHADLLALCMWQAYDQMMFKNLLGMFDTP
jgi:hypothetical protein